MGMRSFFYEGYGFDVSRADDRNVLAFIRDRYDTVKKIPRVPEDSKLPDKGFIDDILSEMGAKDAHFIDDCVFSDDTEDAFARFLEVMPLDKTDGDCYRNRLLEIVAIMLSEESGIPFELFIGQSDCIGDDCIMFLMDAPWNYGKKLSSMTKKDVDAFITPYNVGVNGREAYPPTVLEIEHFG